MRMKASTSPGAAAATFVAAAALKFQSQSSHSHVHKCSDLECSRVFIQRSLDLRTTVCKHYGRPTYDEPGSDEPHADAKVLGMVVPRESTVCGPASFPEGFDAVCANYRSSRRTPCKNLGQFHATNRVHFCHGVPYAQKGRSMTTALDRDARRDRQRQRNMIDDRGFSKVTMFPWREGAFIILRATLKHKLPMRTRSRSGSGRFGFPRGNCLLRGA
jgi:hypothetical protein